MFFKEILDSCNPSPILQTVRGESRIYVNVLKGLLPSIVFVSDINVIECPPNIQHDSQYVPSCAKALNSMEFTYTKSYRCWHRRSARQRAGSTADTLTNVVHVVADISVRNFLQLSFALLIGPSGRHSSRSDLPFVLGIKCYAGASAFRSGLERMMSSRIYRKPEHSQPLWLNEYLVHPV